MTIKHSVGSNIKRPGRYFDFNITAGQRGLAPLDKRIALVGAKTSSGSKAEKDPIRVFSEAEADDYFGTGSEIALMIKWAMKAGRAYGAAPEVWACALADAGGVAAVQHLTVSGAATAAGDVEIRIAGRTIRAGVESGDSASTIATAIAEAIQAEKANLPATAAVDGSVAEQVNVTAVNTGVNGNDIVFDVDKTPAGVTLNSTQNTAGSGTIDITGALDVLNDQDYDFVPIANHTTDDVDDFTSHLDSMWSAATKKWRWGIMAETGTLSTAQTLATQANDYRQVVGSFEGFRNTPGEIAAYVGAMLAAEEDPALPFNGVDLPDLYLPDAADVPTGSELDTGIAGGLLMGKLDANRTKAQITRAVTTKTEHNGVTFEKLLDVTIPRSMVYAARQVDIALALKFPRPKKVARVKKSVRSVTLDVLKNAEDLEIVQNVEKHKGELTVEDDPNNATRLLQAIPTSVVPPLNQFVNALNVLVE